MFEDYTQDYFNDILVEKAAEKGYTATEGTLVYNIIAPMSAMLEDCFSALEDAWENVWADTCDREQLIRFAQMRGLEPYPGNPTRIIIVSTGEIDEGTILSEGDLTFEVEDAVEGESNTYYAECEQAGTEGNAVAIGDTLTDDDGHSATVKSIEAYGEDDEDTEDFRERYFASFGVGGQFGNQAYYLEQVLAVDGVANASVSFDSDTSKVNIQVLPTDATASSEELEKAVEDAVQVSYGHQISVSIAKTVNITIAITSATIASNYTADTAKSAVVTVANEYVTECNNSVNDGTYKLYVMKLISRIMSLDCFVDAVVTVTDSSGSQKTNGVITSESPMYIPADNISIDEA